MTVDQKERRCPRLGSTVSFAYCTQCGDPAGACFKILDCWWEYFDVVSEMKSRLTPEAFKRLQEPKPPDKICSLLEIIEKAKAAGKADP